jgi:stage II sporulation protein R
MKKQESCLKKWELSLLLALCITLCTGVWAQGQQQALAAKMIRLHVIAESDTEADQNFKLRVRDRVLELLTPALEGVRDQAQAREVITRRLPELEAEALAMARASGRECQVSAELGLESYPTRAYDDFSLPAGEYMSLRVTLGEGEGQNWWCVVFPPLCLASVEDSVDAGTLTDGDVSLITEEDTGYVLKFRLIELWEELKASLGD